MRAAVEPLLNEAPGRWESAVATPAVAGGIVWRGPKPTAGAEIARADDVTVLMDGFLSNGRGDRGDAAFVAERYREGDTRALETLEGSFVVAIVDHERGRLVVLTDRSGSRPIYVGRTGTAVVIAPEPKAFCGVAGMDLEIVPGEPEDAGDNGAARHGRNTHQ
ncbi:MAG: hypothetical protein IH912_07305 [Proteobacteria bacterium]|nr:hypothetical protein [Pseudomonadota bacterium]